MRVVAKSILEVRRELPRDLCDEPEPDSDSDSGDRKGDASAAVGHRGGREDVEAFVVSGALQRGGEADEGLDRLHV